MRLKAGNLSWMLVKSFSATESKKSFIFYSCYVCFKKIVGRRKLREMLVSSCFCFWIGRPKR
jgi:hypothetical protein